MTNSDEVYICRDPKTGDIIPPSVPRGWDEVLLKLDQAGVPDDYLADRAQEPPQVREES